MFLSATIITSVSAYWKISVQVQRRHCNTHLFLWVTTACWKHLGFLEWNVADATRLGWIVFHACADELIALHDVIFQTRTQRCAGFRFFFIRITWILQKGFGCRTFNRFRVVFHSVYIVQLGRGLLEWGFLCQERAVECRCHRQGGRAVRNTKMYEQSI